MQKLAVTVLAAELSQDAQSQQYVGRFLDEARAVTLAFVFLRGGQHPGGVTDGGRRFRSAFVPRGWVLPTVFR